MERECTILGVHFRPVSREQLRREVRGWLGASVGFHYIVTPNPEFLVRAAFDRSFRTTLNRADQRVTDGFGLALAARLGWGVPLPRLTGVDCLLEISRLAAEEGHRIFLLGARPGVARRAGECLRRLFPQLLIVGAESGDGPDSPGGQTGVFERLRTARPGILVVAYGAPRQEQWIVRYGPQLPSVRLAIGVGGALDVLSGRLPRAPRLVRRLGLEWLWRLTRQPWRLPRMAVALVVFPALALTDRLRQLLRVRRLG